MTSLTYRQPGRIYPGDRVEAPPEPLKALLPASVAERLAELEDLGTRERAASSKAYSLDRLSESVKRDDALRGAQAIRSGKPDAPKLPGHLKKLERAQSDAAALKAALALAWEEFQALLASVLRAQEREMVDAVQQWDDGRAAHALG